MAITRLTGGLTPADGSDPRTFPTIWNATADQVETAQGDITTLEGRLDNITTDEVAEGSNLYFTNQRADDRADGRIAAATTDDLTEGTTNLYFTDARADARIAAATTDDLTEGSTNLYFTDQRADDRADGRIAAATTDDLTEGATNLYYTDTRVETVISNSDTDDLSEGAVNLYYTDARVESVIANSDTDDLAEGVNNLYFTVQRAADAAPVQSVNGGTGTVVLDADDVGALPDDAGLGDLDDVDLTGLADGNIIQFNSTSGNFEPAAPAGVTTADITALNLTWADF